MESHCFAAGRQNPSSHAVGEVALIAGVNVERTPTLNQAGISQSQLIRFKDDLAQKLGDWQKYYPFALSGKPRGRHAWEDLNGAKATVRAGARSRCSLAIVSIRGELNP
jgi:hypothetical protein